MRAAICETFPEPNRRLLQRILSMMKIVVSHKAVNRMSTSAVAACMAPLLLRPLLAGECELDHDFDMGGDSSIQLMQAAAAANHAQAIVITLLEEYNKFFGEGSNDSGLYSDSEESGSESEELSDDESFEDDEEDDGTEGSYSESYEGSEHASGSFTGTGDSDDDISEDKDDKSSKVDDVEGSELKSAEKSASLLNGPRRSRRSANWGRTPGRKNRSMESIDTSLDDMAEVERLEVSRAELLHKIKEEEKANAVLYENLKKHKNSLHEQRLIFEQDVERLREQLQQERELRAALEVGLEVCEDASSVDDKVKEELEDISGAKTDVTDTRQNADDLEQNCCLMSDRPQLREQSSNQLKDKNKDAAASMKRSETRNKDQLNRDDEKDSKHESKSQIDSVRSSKYSGYPPTSPSNDSAAGKPAVANSKRQNSRGEGTTSSNNALSKLTSRLNFLKEKRTQITSDVQNSEKGRSQGQTAQNSESHSSEKSRGSDHIDQNSDKGVSTEGSSTDRDRRSDTHGTPNLERGKSEHIQKGRHVAPARTMSR